MNTRLRNRLVVFVIMFAAVALFYGCASPNPTFNPAQPPSETNKPFAPNKPASDVANGAGQLAPLVPAPWGTILGGIGVVIGGVAAGIAKRKNDQAIANAAVASQLAASVVAQGPTVAQAVLDHASNNETVFPAVADAVNKKTIS